MPMKLITDDATVYSSGLWRKAGWRIWWFFRPGSVIRATYDGFKTVYETVEEAQHVYDTIFDMFESGDLRVPGSRPWRRDAVRVPRPSLVALGPWL